jgi:DNA-binding MarR family transcriptional regulator
VNAAPGPADAVDSWGFDRAASDAAFAAVGDRVIHVIGRLRRMWPQVQRSLYSVDGRELTLAQIDTVECLTRRPTWRMHEIAAQIGVDPSTASRTIAPLVDLGLAERFTDPADRRYVVVHATERGRSIGHRIVEERRALMHAVIGRLEPARRVLLAELLEEYLAANEVVTAPAPTDDVQDRGA